MIRVRIGDFLNHRRVDKGRGHGDKALDVDEYAAVALHADKHTLGTCKRTADDAHALALGKVARVGVEIDEFLVIGARHLDEVFHLFFGHNDGFAIGLVHDVADGQLGRHLVLLHVGGRDVDENQVVHTGNEALDHHTVALLAAVLHGHEILDAAGIQVFLDFELAVIGHADGKPHLLFASFFHYCPYFHVCKVTVFFVTGHQSAPFHVIIIVTPLIMAKEIKKWTTLESRYIIQRPWLTARVDKVQLPDGRINPEHYVLEYPEWVNIIAITGGGEFVMVRQYRHAMDIVLDELCAGVVEQGETPLQAAQRELLEETGYGGGTWREIMTVGQNPSICDNITHCFLAEGVERVSDQHLDAGEDIAVLLLSRDEVEAMLRENRQLQALMAAPLWRYFAEHK